MNRKKMPASAFLVACLLALHAVAAPPTTPFASDQGRFVASFPAAPEYSVKALPGPAGLQQKHYFTVNMGNTAFVVAYTDYPTPVTLDQVVQTVLAAAKKDGVNVQSSTKVDVGRDPGQRIRLRAPDGTQLATLLVVSANRFYQVTVSVRGAQMTDRHLAFLSTFTLRPPAR